MREQKDMTLAEIADGFIDQLGMTLLNVKEIRVTTHGAPGVHCWGPIPYPHPLVFPGSPTEHFYMMISEELYQHLKGKLTESTVWCKSLEDFKKCDRLLGIAISRQGGL